MTTIQLRGQRNCHSCCLNDLDHHKRRDKRIHATLEDKARRASQTLAVFKAAEINQEGGRGQRSRWCAEDLAVVVLTCRHSVVKPHGKVA
jgi:hypothetical protein